MLQCFLVLHDTESVQVSMILSSSSDETTLGIVPSMNITCRLRLFDGCEHNSKNVSAASKLALLTTRHFALETLNSVMNKSREGK